MIGYVVIGAGYGDEGKGLLTDYLVTQLTTENGQPVNVRFNGGAQAGHTVNRHGRQHVFGHVGSGTFAGASTFLSSRFIACPYALFHELDRLRDMGIIPRIEAHPDCYITTDFDIRINRQLERKRDANRHGSCGLGINETVTRSLSGFRITLADLESRQLGDKLRRAYKEWWLPRVKELDLIMERDFTSGELIDQELINLSSAPSLFGNISTKPLKNFSNREFVVLEGAQGLELDEFLGDFPHVTRSITGLPSALLAAAEVGIEELIPIYVTRAYKTRHGAGPLLHEAEKITSKTLYDRTNVHGAFQGELRYAPLDIEQLYEIIDADFDRAVELEQVTRIKVSEPVLAVTCLDQIDDIVFYDIDGNRRESGKAHLLSELEKAYPIRYVSGGPSAEDVTRFE